MRDAVALGLVAAAVGSGSAEAGKPATERIDIDETYLDDFLTEACGTDVTTRAQGHLTVRQYPNDKRLLELVTTNVTLRASSAEGRFQFKDVGRDAVRTDRDGRLVRQTSGQVPFTFTGRLVVDAETGEVIQQPVHSLERQLTRACGRLNPA